MKKSISFLLIFISVFLQSCHRINTFPVVSTYAGNKVMGSANGKATDAFFSNPMGVAADNLGNIFIADARNNMIRKISPEGMVTTLAGTGATGSVDGRGDMATFFFPEGVAVDNNGNVFVADTHNSLIRKISPDGFVTTLAGQRIYHTIPGRDTSVRFDNPSGIATDRRGNVYVADWANNLIRKINPDGKVTNIAGNGDRGAKDSSGSFASFYLPGALTLDSAGNIYVADTYNNVIRKITPAGQVSTIAGKTTRGSVNGKRDVASFSHPAGIAVDKEENIYVSDMENNKIRKISPDGMVTVFAGSGLRGSSNGRDSVAAFYRPYGIAIGKNGNIYVADCLNNQIRQISF